MLAIAAMSTARLLPQGMTNGILRACFRGVFHLPGHEDGTDMDTSLYVRTVEALDSLLQALVSSAGACGLLELQNILKLLLPFTQQQPEAMEERAMVRIAGLAAFLNTCSLPQVSSCFAGATVLRHHHPEKHRFALLGRLVGYLLLCCTCESEGKSHEAAKAVRHLCLFVTQQRSTRLCDQDAEQPQGWQSWRARLSLRLSEDSNSNRMFMIFMKYLQPSERLGVFLAAVQSMRAPSPHSTELAAHMVDVLAAETDFHSGQVLHIVWAIYRSLPSVRAALALQSLDRALLLLASKRPRETVASLLQCSLTCTSVAVTMWRAMVSEPPATERVLHELLRILMNQSGCKTSTSTKDHPRIQALAAARPLHEILLLPTSRGEAKAIFPQLFLALLFQVSFTTELKLQEVQVFWEKHQQDLLTPVRSTVQALKALLRSVGLGSQVLAIEAQGVWAALLSAESHLWGVQVVAREMKELPRSLRTTIIHQLVELLRTEASSWQTVAMVILRKVSRGSRSSEPTWGSAQALLPRGQAWPCPGIPALAFLLLSRHCAPRPFQLLECTELGDELDCVVSLFASYLRSPCLGMQSLVLRAILGLTERPATARQTLVLLPSITEQLQAADSDTRAVALPMLSTMLRLLEGRTLSLAALELASKLPALFGDDSSTVRLLSIRLFLDTLGFVEGSQEKLQQVAHRSLLPLSFHLHDQDESVAEASREALLGVARFLRWRQLAHLAETLRAGRSASACWPGGAAQQRSTWPRACPTCRACRSPCGGRL
ncbi:maestro heat-like repeat family member 5 [Anas platyrhynchos]|uniref:maestro heat-like repeat family member 5 n=1 Tax=Anas platyrhynchos TaxID=8839 RepID=UPI003AF2F2BB